MIHLYATTVSWHAIWRIYKLFFDEEEFVGDRTYDEILQTNTSPVCSPISSPIKQRDSWKHFDKIWLRVTLRNWFFEELLPFERKLGNNTRKTKKRRWGPSRNTATKLLTWITNFRRAMVNTFLCYPL